MSSLLDQAQAALLAGQKSQAQGLVSQTLKANPRDEQAWLLLEQCVDQLDRKKYCLQQILAINPNNVLARQRLTELESPPPPPPPPAPARTPQPAVNDFDSISESDETFEALEPDSPPTVTDLEAALMDKASYKPSPFTIPGDEGLADETDDDWRAEAIEPEIEALDAAPDDSTSEPPPPPITPLDPATLRAKLEQGVALIEQGNKFEGVPILEAVAAADPKNETAWLWLGAAADDDHRKREYFQKALAINPRNKLARDLLKPVEARLGPEAQPQPVVGDTAPTATPANRNGWIILVFVVLIIVVIATFLVVWYLNRQG